ncbi:MAG: hypothetical protein ACRYFB_13935 [Janthinobacterium lividum]
MKPVENAISDASFIGHYFKLLVFHLHKFKTAKHVVLIGVVLICVLARYVALLDDKNQVQNKPESISEKYQKNPVQVDKLMLIPNSSNIKKNNFFKIRRIRLNPEKTDLKYFTANEMP